MAGIEMFVNGGPVSPINLVTAIGRLFKITTDEINLVLSEDRDWFADSEKYQVICVIREVAGEFTTRIDIIPLKASLIPRDALEFVGGLCERLNCHAVVPYGDESMSPYSWTLVRGIRDYYNVKVDPELLDDEDNYGLTIVRLEGKQELGSASDKA